MVPFFQCHAAFGENGQVIRLLPSPLGLYAPICEILDHKSMFQLKLHNCETRCSFGLLARNLGVQMLRILLMTCISLGTVRRYSGSGQTSTEHQLDDRKGRSMEQVFRFSIRRNGGRRQKNIQENFCLCS